MGQVSFQGHTLIMFSHAPRDLALLSTADGGGEEGESVCVCVCGRERRERVRERDRG